MKKKLINICLIALLVVGLVPTIVFADTTPTIIQSVQYLGTIDLYVPNWQYTNGSTLVTWYQYQVISTGSPEPTDKYNKKYIISETQDNYYMIRDTANAYEQGDTTVIGFANIAFSKTSNQFSGDYPKLYNLWYNAESVPGNGYGNPENYIIYTTEPLFGLAILNSNKDSSIDGLHAGYPTNTYIFPPANLRNITNKFEGEYGSIDIEPYIGTGAPWFYEYDLITTSHGYDRIQIFINNEKVADYVTTNTPPVSQPIDNFKNRTVLVGKLIEGANYLKIIASRSSIIGTTDTDVFEDYIQFMGEDVPDNPNDGYVPPVGGGGSVSTPIPPDSNWDILGWIRYIGEWIWYGASSIGTLFSSLAASFISMISGANQVIGALGALFSFMPAELISVITVGLTAIMVVGFVKVIRR